MNMEGVQGVQVRMMNMFGTVPPLTHQLRLGESATASGRPCHFFGCGTLQPHIRKQRQSRLNSLVNYL